MGDSVTEDEQQKLNLEAPLISARRFSAPPGSTTTSSTTGNSNNNNNSSNSSRRSLLPFYKSDLKSGPVGKPGIVPFLWEQSPGRPKDNSTTAINAANSVRTRPKPPPGRVTVGRNKDFEYEIQPPGKESAAFDALDSSSSISTTENGVSFRNESKERFVESSVEMTVNLEGKKMIFVEGNSRGEGFENGEEEGEVDEDEFADALDALSRTDSFTMNCSVSRLSVSTEGSGRFWSDPQARDLMIDRFLPAAQAMASSSLQCGSRRSNSVVKESPRPLPAVVKRNMNGDADKLTITSLQYPNKVDYAPELTLQNNRDVGDEEQEIEEEFEDYNSSHMVSKGCGLLPRLFLKGPSGLLNPRPGRKVPAREPGHLGKVNGSPLESTHNASVHQSGYENSWEAVYKHKLGRGDPAQLEDTGRPISESNQLGGWSNSPTTDGSSPYRRWGSGISPYKNEAHQSPFNEGRGFLGTPSSGKTSSKDGASDLSDKGENYWEETHSGSLKGSGSLSPGTGRTLSMDSVLTTEFSNSNLTSMDALVNLKAILASDSRLIAENQTIENSVSGVCVSAATQCNSKTLESEMPLSLQTRNGSSTLNHPHDDLLHVEMHNPLHHNSGQSPLLPPQLPKGPSESWLRRTLPSVSSTSSPKSLLGIEVHNRKKAAKASSVDTKKGDNKPSKPHRQIRFAEVLVKPRSPHSEV